MTCSVQLRAKGHGSGALPFCTITLGPANLQAISQTHTAGLASPVAIKEDHGRAETAIKEEEIHTAFLKC